MALPSFQDMRSLPPQRRSTILNIAQRTLRMFCYPKALLWLQKRNRLRLIEAAKGCPKPDANLFKTWPMFKAWPQPLIAPVRCGRGAVCGLVRAEVPSVRAVRDGVYDIVIVCEEWGGVTSGDYNERNTE